MRDREYMGGIQRDKLRVKQTEEVFTRQDTARFVVEKIEKFYPGIFSDPNKKVVDSTGCGDGQLLSEVLIKRIENGIDFEKAISTLYGVEKELDNVKLCRERLLCKQNDLKHIVEKNIVHSSYQKYNFGFGESYTIGNGLFEVVD